MSSCSAAVVEYLGGVDNLAHYGRSLGLIEGLLKVRVADTPIGAPMNSTPRMRWVSPAEELPGAGRLPILNSTLHTLSASRRWGLASRVWASSQSAYTSTFSMRTPAVRLMSLMYSAIAKNPVCGVASSPRLLHHP